MRHPGRVAVAAIAVFLLAVLAGCSTAPKHITEPGPEVGQSINRKLPTSIDNTLLISSTGERLTLASLRGKIIVLSDIMTLCQETCPIDTAAVLQAARAVEKAGLGDKIEFISATVDPTRDTLPQLAAFKKLYGKVPSNWRVVTGGVSQLAAFWSKFGVFVKKTANDESPAPRNWRTGVPLTYDLAHSDDVIFIDASGHERFALDGSPALGGDAPIPSTLRGFLSDEGDQHLNHPAAHSWTVGSEMRVLSWLLDKRVSATG